MYKDTFLYVRSVLVQKCVSARGGAARGAERLPRHILVGTVDSTEYAPRVFGVSSGETKSVNEDTSHKEYTNLVHKENYSYYEDDDGNVNNQLNSETYDSYEYCRNDRNKIVGTRYTGTLTKTYVYDDDHNYLYTVVDRNPGNGTCPP